MKKKKGAISSTLLFVKREDVNGNNYYLDTKTGKRANGYKYDAQWSKKGRVTKETTKAVIDLVENKTISKKDIRTTTNDMYFMDVEMKDQKKHEEAFKRSGEIEAELYFNVGTQLEEAKSGDSKIMIKGVDKHKYQEYEGLELQMEYEAYIDFANEIMDELNEGKPKVKNYVTYTLKVDALTNTWYFDFSNFGSKTLNDSILEDLSK